jgi:hypothetical protein
MAVAERPGRPTGLRGGRISQSRGPWPAYAGNSATDPLRTSGRAPAWIAPPPSPLTHTIDHSPYIRLAAMSARVQPARSPRASSRLARANVALNIACARCSARLTEPGVGWRSSCAPIDCGANGPAFGLPADWRTACSNCAMSLLHGPACADATPRHRAATTKTAVTFTMLSHTVPWDPPYAADTRFTPGGDHVPSPTGRIEGGAVFGQ